MGSFEKEKIGPLFAWGGEHIVYRYGSDKVLKYSILYYVLGKHALAKAHRDYALCKQYLGDYILYTDIIVSPSGKHVVHMQPWISGRPLMQADLKDPQIKVKCIDLLARYALLIEKENLPIDLIGREGVFSGGLTNIFVTDTRELKIIDATGLEFSKTGILMPILTAIKSFILWRQGINIKAFEIAILTE